MSPKILFFQLESHISLFPIRLVQIRIERIKIIIIIFENFGPKMMFDIINPSDVDPDSNEEPVRIDANGDNPPEPDSGNVNNPEKDDVQGKKGSASGKKDCEICDEKDIGLDHNGKTRDVSSADNPEEPKVLGTPTGAQDPREEEDQTSSTSRNDDSCV